MSRRSLELSRELISVLENEGPRLSTLQEAEARLRHGNVQGWSRKMEMGHLIDSAVNNRVRFVKAGIEGAYTGPSYDGEGWVKLGGYESMEWPELLLLWTVQNKALARLIGNIPHEKLTGACQVGYATPVTLGFLIEDYILHMQHHLDHVLGRDTSTSYPGAAMGV